MSGMCLETMIEILERHDVPVDVFVETGTYLADTTLLMRNLFDEVHTVELSQTLFDQAVSKWATTKVHFHQGASPEWLAEIGSQIERPAVFYLDAHWVGLKGAAPGVTKDDPMPLMRELEALAPRPYADIVVVDDLHAFGRKDGKRSIGWAGVSRRAVRKALKGAGGALVGRSYGIKDQFVVHRVPVAQEDRATVSEAVSTGSSPVGDTERDAE